MILPQSYPAVLFLMVLSLLCLGSWASAFKFAGKWRFEMFYLDFAIGLLLASVIFAFTVGNIGYDGFNFLDDLQHAGKRQWLYVFDRRPDLQPRQHAADGGGVGVRPGSGVSDGNGNGAAAGNRSGHRRRGRRAIRMLLGLGCLLILTSIIVNAVSYRIMGVAQHEALARAGQAKSTRRPSPLKGIILALAAGLLHRRLRPAGGKGAAGRPGVGALRGRLHLRVRQCSSPASSTISSS